MKVSVEAGTALVVIQKGAVPVQREGVVVAVKGTALALRIDESAAWSDAAETVLIISHAEGRSRASARYVACQNDVYAFALTSRWQRLELRSSPRYRLDLGVRVSSVLGQSRQDGKMVDVSLGGLAVRVPTKPGGGAVEVEINRDGFTSHLRCEIVGSVAEESSVLLRLRYAELNHVQLAFVRRLVRSALEDPAAALEAARDDEPLAS